MESVNVAILGGPGANDLASKIAKKGGETDVTQYNLKKGDRSLTLFVPAKYPEKIQGVSYSLQAADHIVLVVDALDRRLGEQIVAIDMTGRTDGFLILRNYIQHDQMKPLLAGTALEHYKVLESDDPIVLRDMLIGLSASAQEGATRVDVDQHFNVKGVGTVVLGVVTRGEVKRHQELTVHPIGKKCIVRSIQVHDTDMDTAGCGSRVGLALKNIESEELDRGNVLAPDGTIRTVKKGERIELDVKVPKFYKTGLKEGQVVHVGTGVQFLPAKIASGNAAAGTTSKLALEVQNPLVVMPGDRVVLFSLDAPDLRVAGGAAVP